MSMDNKDVAILGHEEDIAGRDDIDNEEKNKGKS